MEMRRGHLELGEASRAVTAEMVLSVRQTLLSVVAQARKNPKD